MPQKTLNNDIHCTDSGINWKLGETNVLTLSMNKQTQKKLLNNYN
jgi:hypothetical protein